MFVQLRMRLPGQSFGVLHTFIFKETPAKHDAILSFDRTFLPPPPAFRHPHPRAWKRRGGMFVQLRMTLPGQRFSILQTFILRKYREGMIYILK